MKFSSFFKNFMKEKRKPVFGGLEILKYIGPGLLVTVGFIDPGNWASNIAAGANFGYTLLWMVTLSTLMLIILQHNAAHLGIATGLCLSEASSLHLPLAVSSISLSTSVIAATATAMAEILGASIALSMLFNIPVKIGAILTTLLVLIMLYTNSYRKIEKWIIGFVSLIGLCFIFELTLVHINWPETIKSCVIPTFPAGSLPIIMSVLGAVVMPHNIFLHSEIIQSRQWNLKDEKEINKQLKFEFADTLFSMIVGWAINSAMIILAASVFFTSRVAVTELDQAARLLDPLLGKSAFLVFALALLFSGIASSITAGMAGGSIFAGIFHKPYDIKDKHSKLGIGITFIFALAIIFLIQNPFSGLIISQMFLSIQLPFTIIPLIYLTSSQKVMGKFANRLFTRIILITIASIVIGLNIMLLMSSIG